VSFVLVSGGTGFVGSRVVQQLLLDRDKNPWDEVKVLVRSDKSAERVRACGATPVPGDLLEPSDDGWRGAVAGASYVVHCAQPSRGAAPELRSKMDEHLLSALDPRARARVVLVFGSSYYGRTLPGELGDETMRPRRPIGLGPLFEPGVRALDKAVRAGLDAVGAFVGAVYGPRSWFLRWYREAIVAGQPIPMCAPAPVWPYIHIDDCARAIELLVRVPRAQLDASGREVILAGDAPAGMDEFVTCVAEQLGKTPHFEWSDEAALRARLPPLVADYVCASMAHGNARLRSLGFACRYRDVREGVASLRVWLEGRGPPGG
jgi:nucleoside-diphosphate-sugar epimerase